MQSSFQLPQQFSEELVLFAVHTPALQKYSEVSESNTQISGERLGLGEAGTNTRCDLSCWKHSWWRCSHTWMWQAWRASSAEAFNTSFSPEPPAESCLLRKSQTKMQLQTFSPFAHPKQPTQALTTLLWQLSHPTVSWGIVLLMRPPVWGGGCSVAMRFSHPCESMSSHPWLCQTCLSPRRSFRSSRPSCHPKIHQPFGWALWWFGHKPWPAKGLGMQLWWNGELRKCSRGTNSVSTSSGQWCSPKAPVLLCTKLSEEGCVHRLQKLSTLDGRCEAAWKHWLFGKKPQNFNQSFGQTQPDLWKQNEPNKWISMRSNPVRAGREGSCLSTCHNIWTLPSSFENKRCQCKGGWWRGVGRGWWDWEVVPGPPEVLNQGFHGTGGALRVTKHWNSLSSREEVAEDGMNHPGLPHSKRQIEFEFPWVWLIPRRAHSSSTNSHTQLWTDPPIWDLIWLLGLFLPLAPTPGTAQHYRGQHTEILFFR